MPLVRYPHMSSSSLVASSELPSTIPYLSLDGDPPNPLDIESAKALEYIGFTASAAEEIWEHYANRPIPEQHHLMSFVCEYMSLLLSEPFENIEPRMSMTIMGLDTRTQEMIVSPRYSGYLATGNLYRAVKQLLELRYNRWISSADI